MYRCIEPNMRSAISRAAGSRCSLSDRGTFQRTPTQLGTPRCSFDETTVPKAPEIGIRYLRDGLRSRERVSRLRRSHAQDPSYETATGRVPSRVASGSGYLGSIRGRYERARLRRVYGIRRAATTDTIGAPQRP